MAMVDYGWWNHCHAMAHATKRGRREEEEGEEEEEEEEEEMGVSDRSK